MKQTQDRSRLQELKIELQKFSRREIEIIKYLREGLHRNLIADRLCISEYTIKRHLENIRAKGEPVSIMALVEKFREVL